MQEKLEKDSCLSLQNTMYLRCRVILAADMNCCSTKLLVFCTRERPRLKGDKLYERKTFGALGH